MWEYLTERHEQIQDELRQLAQLYKMWALREPILDAHICALEGKIKRLEQEIDEMVTERIAADRK